MAALLSFFLRLAPFIYILSALVLMIGLRRLFQARVERHAAVFGLEREIADRHVRLATTTVVLAGTLAFAEFFLVAFLAPNIPSLARLATPTMNPLLTPAVPLQLGNMETLGFATPGATMTIQTTGCIPGQIAITSPKPGDEIKGKVTLMGTANVPNFGFYKYEFSPAGSGTWNTIVAKNKAVQDGELGIWDTTAIAVGDYQLRLVVTDNQGFELPTCVVPIRIKTP